MQQTSLDRWLRKKYVYKTNIFTNTLPQDIPPGVTVEETSEEMGGMYLYRFTAKTEQQLNELTARLEMANITYTSRVIGSSGTSEKLFGNPNKSFTMQVSWVIFIIAVLAIIFSGLPVHLWKTLSVEDEAEKGKKPPSSKIVDFLTK